ncbi:MAG: hypothetical protein AAF333_12190 [Planctomycetota bacterium]
MIRWFRQLDEVLRGDATRAGRLGGGGRETPGDGERISLRGLTAVAVLLSAVYGLSVGAFAAIRTGGAELYQMFASAAKMPMLFFLTLLVTLPSLYVFSALVGAGMKVGAVCRLLVAMLGVVTAVLASFAPIVVFFGVSTTSYPFMKLLNVAMCAVAGLLGLAFLVRTLRAMVGDGATPAAEIVETDGREGEAVPKTERSEADRRASVVFRVWVVLFAFVGVQMSWVLRPFIGDPALPFAWFRNRESNFFTDVWSALIALLGG